MKLAPLLAQYLYTNKRLDLPGIGSFLLDPSVNIEPGKPVNTEAISFERKISVKEVPDLINFISANTGKMKALAAADLDSYLQLALQFLNIGNPFLLEGIGRLVKESSGQFVFLPGDTTQEKLKEYTAREISATSSAEESFNRYEDEKKKRDWKTPVTVFFLLAGIGLAIWAGYRISKKSTAGNKTVIENKKEESFPVNDSVLFQKDSAIKPQQALTSGNYKFVLEIANRKRAFERFEKLKSYQWNIQMETKDSVQYKLFVMIPAPITDTTRLSDSLTALNGRKVYIEN